MSVVDGETRGMNDLSHGIILSQILFHIYTNDQSLHSGTRNYIYADNMRVTVQHPLFKQTGYTIKDALGEPIQYYRNNSVCANPEKTKVIVFHIRNNEANRELGNLEWNDIGEYIPSIEFRCYLGHITQL